MTNTPAVKLTGLAYVPRWIGGIGCYITFGIGGLLSSLTILPLVRFWPGTKLKRIRRIQKMVHIMFRGFVYMLTWTGIIKVSSENIERLASAKGRLVIANHPTLIDIVVLISLMPNSTCIVKQGVWRNPFMRGVIACAGYIPNRGVELLLEDCKHVLKNGTNLIIFPEGTRTALGSSINGFTRGAANIAIRTKTDILPVVLRTNASGLSKQEAWYEIPRRTIGMQVEVGKTIDHTRYDGIAGSNAKIARQITRDLEDYFKMNLKNDKTT